MGRGYVRSSAQLGVDMAEGRQGSGLAQPQVEQEYGQALAGLVDAERSPEVSRSSPPACSSSRRPTARNRPTSTSVST
ncbi:hypothetical protein [Micromonospora avicenniae]|uniref:hypothetical protein n=1 Tax=Micromonospora avicenniae TaxID=1198245 RepID=UPI003328CE94